VRLNFFLFLRDSFRESCSKFINSAFIQNENDKLIIGTTAYLLKFYQMFDPEPTPFTSLVSKVLLSHMVHRKKCNGFQIETRQRLAAHMWLVHWISDRNAATLRSTHVVDAWILYRNAALIRSTHVVDALDFFR
jgi:hypothetical protein